MFAMFCPINAENQPNLMGSHIFLERERERERREIERVTEKERERDRQTERDQFDKKVFLHVTIPKLLF